MSDNVGSREEQSGRNDMTERRVVPSESLPPLPFGAMWSTIGPGMSSPHQMHHEGETFFIADGSGAVRIGHDSRQVAAGDVVYVPPFQHHSFVNTASDTDLRYLSLWWDDQRLSRMMHEEGQIKPNVEGRRILLTATPPTVNGELHLGHIAGPYLAADVLRRYLALRGETVAYVTGMDENQSYVLTKGRQKGMSPTETAEVFGEQVSQGWAALNIRPDVIARPATSVHHTRMCQEFFARLYAQGKLVSITGPAAHCETCNRYLFEAHISGLCPHCGRHSDGSACEDCARPNDCIDLVDARCDGCGGSPGIREVTRLHFPLSQYSAELREYLSSVAMPEHMRALCTTMLDDGLPDIPVSHPTDWGIPVPVEGFDDQVMYVWFEMCPGYLAATQQVLDDRGGGDWRDYWCDHHAEIVQFFGFDNGYFHALLFPALLMAYDSSIRLPSAFVTNEFYLLEGRKFSSSREHAIWAREFAVTQPTDWIRFYLSADRPDHERTNFTYAGFEAMAQHELQDRWLGWLTSVGRRVVQVCDGRAPGTGPYTAGQRRFFDAMTAAVRHMEDAFDHTAFSPAAAARVLLEFVRVAESFGASQSNLIGVAGCGDELFTGLALELAAARLFAIIAAPIVPDLSCRLSTALGFGAHELTGWEPAPVFVPAGQDVSALTDLQWGPPAVLPQTTPRTTSAKH